MVRFFLLILKSMVADSNVEKMILFYFIVHERCVNFTVQAKLKDIYKDIFQNK